VPQDKSLYHYEENIISEESQRDLLLAVFQMARTNHIGCINFLLKLADIQKPRDWDGQQARKYPDRQHGYRARKQPVMQQYIMESEAEIIHYLCVAN